MLFYFGVDVHVTNYTVVVLQPPIIGMSNCESVIHETRVLRPDYNEIIKMVDMYKKTYGESTTVIIGYEAGCLGTSLYRELEKHKLKCIILAPTTMASTPLDDLYKNDKRDAKKIAECLVTGLYKSVYVNTQHNEAVANLIRLRDSAQERVKIIKQQTMAYCHRFGFIFASTYWTNKHFEWFKGLQFDEPLAREILDDYLLDLQTATERVEFYDKRIAEVADEAKYADSVAKLGCFLGMSQARSLAVIAEIGDFKRFDSANHFASYLGLVPGIHASGNKNPRRPITKAGNSHLRKLLVEAAQGICKGQTGHKSKELKKRQSGQSDVVVAYADKGNIRFRKKYYRMIHAGKMRNTAVTAIARELACFIWGMMTNHYNVAGVSGENVA